MEARPPHQRLTKRLRYAVEFVADVYGRPAHRFVRRVTELQDLLGNHQDAQVAGDQLRAMVSQPAANLPHEVVFVMGELAQRYADDAAVLRSRFVKSYKRATGRRWRKLQQAFKAGQHRATSPSVRQALTVRSHRRD